MPFNFYLSPTRILFWSKPFGVKIGPATAALGLSTSAPTVNSIRLVTPNTASLSVAGSTPFGSSSSSKWQYYVAPTQFVYFRSGQAPPSVVPQTGALSFSTTAPLLGSYRQAVVGAVTISGSSPLLARDVRPLTGAVSIVGSQASFPAQNINPGTGSIVLTEFSPQNKAGSVFVAPWYAYGAPTQVIWWFSGAANPALIGATGSISLVGKTPTLVTQEGTRQPSTGAVSFAGDTVGIGRTFTVTPTAGSVVFTAQTAVVQGAGQIITQSGALTLTGQVSTQQITVTPAVGAVLISGQAAEADSATYRTPAVGALTVTGVAPQFIIGTGRQPGAGALVLDGQQPIQVLDLSIQPDNGSLGINIEDAPSTPDTAEEMALAGYAPILRYIDQISPETGAIIVDGQNCDSSISGQSATKTPATGSLTIRGKHGVDIELLHPIHPHAFGTLFNRPQRAWMYRPWTRK